VPIIVPRPAAGAGRSRRRRRACIAAAGALGAVAALAAPAGASLSAVGPVNPLTGYPDWYQDAPGLKLQLCLDGPPNCLAAKGDLVAPDGEAFWWQAQATVPVGAGEAIVTMAQEAAFLDTNRISFARVRVRINGARPNTLYRVQHPYGTDSVTTDATGRGTVTEDIGCTPELGAPCNWPVALQGRVGPFLTWDPAVAPAPPAGFVGDAVTPHKVVGSPTKFNRVTVSGTGATAASSTDLFTVQGKLAGPPVPVATPSQSSVDFGAPLIGTPTTQTITVTSNGVPDAGGASNLALGAVAVSGAGFAVAGDTCSGQVLPSGQSCAVTVQFVPGAVDAQAGSLVVPSNAAGGATTIALAGAGTAPPPPPPAAVAAAPPAAPAAAPRPRFAVAGLEVTRRISRARLRRRGLTVTFRMPRGANVVRLAIHQVRRGRTVRKALWVTYRVPRRAGVVRMRLRGRTLARRLKRGRYELRVRPGRSRRDLGAVTRTRFRVR
jgi:hypothetical protein